MGELVLEGVKTNIDYQYEIINDESKEIPFYQKANLGKSEAESINYKWMKKQKLTTKDLICPSYMKFHKDHVDLGNRIGKLYYIKNLLHS